MDQTVSVNSKAHARLRGKRLLIVDDLEQTLLELRKIMEAAGMEVITLLADQRDFEEDLSAYRLDGKFHNSEEFAVRIASLNIDAMLTDGQMLPDFDGMDAIRELQRIKPGTPSIMHSGKYEDLRLFRGSDNAAAVFNEDNDMIQQLGGIGAFGKGQTSDILDAFMGAFDAQKAPLQRGKIAIVTDGRHHDEMPACFKEAGYDVHPLTGKQINGLLSPESGVTPAIQPDYVLVRPFAFCNEAEGNNLIDAIQAIWPQAKLIVQSVFHHPLGESRLALRPYHPSSKWTERRGSPSVMIALPEISFEQIHRHFQGQQTIRQPG